MQSLPFLFPRKSKNQEFDLRQDFTNQNQIDLFNISKINHIENTRFFEFQLSEVIGLISIYQIKMNAFCDN